MSTNVARSEIVRSEDVNPEMVSLARQARGITQSGLATRMKIAQGTVSKVEAGIMPPTDEDLQKLSDALDFPKSFFTQHRTIPGPGMSELFHRKRQRTGVKDLNRVYSNATIQIMNIEDLLRSWENNESNVPSLPIEDFDDNPEKIARTVRAMWQLPPGPVFNLTRTVERFGAVVIATDLKTKHIDGFSRCTHDTPPMIFLNSHLLPDRWRWTLAHELAHIVMHMSPPTEDRDIEREADRFAGEFLAPSYEIKPQLYNLTLKKLPALKQYWKISMQAICMRASHLGILNERQKRYMFMQLSKAGYRTREPETLDPPSEKPELIAKIVMFHLRNLDYSVEQLISTLRLGKEDFHKLHKPLEPYLQLID